MKSVKKLVAGMGFAVAMAASTPASAFTQLFLLDGAGTQLYSSFIGSPNSATIVLGGVLNGWDISLAGGSTNDPGTFKMDIQASAFFSGSAVNTLIPLTILGQTSMYLNGGMSTNLLDKSVLRIRVISDAYPLNIGSTVNLTDSFGLSNTPVGNRTGAVGTVNGLSAIEIDTNNAGTLSPNTGPSNFQSAPTFYSTPTGQNFTYSFVQNAFGNVMQGGIDLILPTTAGVSAATFAGLSAAKQALCQLQPDNTYTCLSTQTSNNRFATTSSIQASVPEPGTLALLGISLLGIAAIRRKRAV